MTQTADTKTWAETFKIGAFNFMETISPPERIGRNDYVARIIMITKEEGIPLINDDWLALNKNSLGSVLRGLTEMDFIDRGTFVKYID